MSLTKERLIYDPADAAESDITGAYLLSSDGTELTHSTVGSAEALDVYLQGLESASFGVFAEDAVHNSGDLGQFVLAVQTANQGALAADGDYAPLQVDPQGRLRVIGDLDLIGDLVADDEVDSEDPLKIGFRAVSGALAAASASGDKVNAIADLYRRQFVNEAPSIGHAVATVTVGTLEAALPTTALAGRKWITIQNTSNSDVYVGPTGVTTSNGIRIGKGATLEMLLGESVTLYGIAGSAGNDVRVYERA